MVSSTRRLADEDRLEAALERRVLLDVLAVLVERGGADHAQLAARQHRLEHVAGVHRALGRAGADDRVHLVDEDDDLAVGVGDLLEHRLEALLELAAVLGAGDHRRQVERDDALVLAAPRARRRRRCAGPAPRRWRSCRRRARRSAPGCSWCGASSTWMTRRISSSRPMTGSSLPARGRLGEVAAVLLERLVLLLGVLAGDPVRCRGPPGAPAPASSSAGDADLVGQGQQEVLGRHVVVAAARSRASSARSNTVARSRRQLGSRRRTTWAAWRSRSSARLRSVRGVDADLAAARAGRRRRPGAAARRGGDRA